MLIAISSIAQQKTALDRYERTNNDIYIELEKTFDDKIEAWNITISKDLTIKFNDPDILFSYASSKINDNFNNILKEFVPKYIKIINKEEYKNHIKEVRIEGHAKEHCLSQRNNLTKNYISCIPLSSDRAKSVLENILRSDYFTTLSEPDTEKMLWWLMSIWMSTGKPLDDLGNPFLLESSTNTPISDKSRRVEFKIVTSSEELIKEIN